MNKSTLIALLVFVGLIIAAVSTMQDKPERGVTRLSMEHIDVAAIDRFLIGADDGISIEKKDGRWRLAGKLADQTAVDRVIEAVAKIRSSDLASRNTERYADLEVDDEKGTRVRLYSVGATVADMVLGSSARGGSHVRVGEEVYSVAGIYRASFARDRAGWIERRFFFDEVGDVERVVVTVGGAPTYTLIAREGKWDLEDASLLPEGHRFDSEAATRLVQALLAARAEEVLDGEPEETTGLEEGADRLVYRVRGDDRERALLLGAGEGASVFARSTELEHLLTLRSPVADGLRKKLSNLRDFGLVRLDPQAVTRLSIVNGDEQLELEKRDGAWAIAESTATVGDDFVLDPAAVMRRVTEFGRVRAIAESDPTSPMDVAGAAQKVTATLSDESEVVLAFGPEASWQESTVAAAVGNVDAKTYLVETSVRDQLLRGIDSFERVEPAAPASGLSGLDPQALQNLPPEIRDSLLKQMAEEQQRQEMMKRALEAQGAGN